MFKKLSERDREVLAILKEAGAPSKNLIGSKFEYIFLSRKISFIGIVGSVQFWLKENDPDALERRERWGVNENLGIIITPTTPFFVHYDSSLIIGFYYDIETRVWVSFDNTFREQNSGDIIFYKK